MSDYIKREDAIKVACGDCPYNCSEVRKKEHPCKEYKELMAIPYADVEEVVRCKDCLWFEIAVMKADGTPDKRYKPDWCGLHRIVMAGDNYCSDGWKDSGAMMDGGEIDETD